MGKIFGSLLKEARTRAGLSAHGLALSSGLFPGNLYAMERGTRPPSASSLEKLARAPEFGLGLPELKAMAALDRMGDDWPAAKAWLEQHGWETLAEATGVELGEQG